MPNATERLLLCGRDCFGYERRNRDWPPGEFPYRNILAHGVVQVIFHNWSSGENNRESADFESKK